MDRYKEQLAFWNDTVGMEEELRHDDGVSILTLCNELATTLTDTEAKLAEAEKQNAALTNVHACDMNDIVLLTLARDEYAAQVANLQSQLSSAEARGLERAAQWHDAQAEIERRRPAGNAQDRNANRHTADAVSIRALITSPMPSQRERELALLRWIKDPFHWYYDDQRYKTPEEVLDAFNTQSKDVKD